MCIFQDQLAILSVQKDYFKCQKMITNAKISSLFPFLVQFFDIKLQNMYLLKSALMLKNKNIAIPFNAL